MILTTIGNNFALNRVVIPKSLISVISFVILVGCQSNVEKDCSEAISPEQLQTSEHLVLLYVSRVVSVQQSQVFEEYYRLSRSQVCQNSILLYYEPDLSKYNPNSGIQPTGSSVRYIINPKTSEVIKDYLD